MRKLNIIAAHAFGLSILFLVSPAAAMQKTGGKFCSASSPGFNFGNYDAFSNVPLDGVGSITVSCNNKTSFTISLSPGSGTYTERKMVNGLRTMSYNLYVDATRLSVFGDGTSGTQTISQFSTGGTFAVYGRIPASQNPWFGAYSDTIVVTITY